MILKGLELLTSWGLLSDALAVEDWARGLQDLDTDCLREGFKRAKDYSGYMTLGDFRKLCKKPRTHASYKTFEALPNKPASKEFILANNKKLREKLGL